MNILDPRETRFRGLLFFWESRKSNSFNLGHDGMGSGEEFTDSRLKNFDKKRMERYSVSQVVT
jgi:hypothetical protein